MEQLIILLFIGAIFLGKTFVKKLSEDSQDQGEQPPASRPQTPFRPISRNEDEQERLRNFMEALGLPSDAAPPPPPVIRRSPVVQPAQAEPAREAVRQLPPRQFAARPMQQEQQPLRLRRSGAALIPPPIFKSVPSVPSSSISSAASPFGVPPLGGSQSSKEAYGLTSAAEVQAQSLIPTNAATAGILPRSPAVSPLPEKRPAALRDLLAAQASLRSAVVLREILGPPRSLQPLRPFAGL